MIKMRRRARRRVERACFAYVKALLVVAYCRLLPLLLRLESIVGGHFFAFPRGQTDEIRALVCGTISWKHVLISEWHPAPHLRVTHIVPARRPGPANVMSQMNSIKMTNRSGARLLSAAKFSLFALHRAPMAGAHNGGREGRKEKVGWLAIGTATHNVSSDCRRKTLDIHVSWARSGFFGAGVLVSRPKV